MEIVSFHFKTFAKLILRYTRSPITKAKMWETENKIVIGEIKKIVYEPTPLCEQIKTGNSTNVQKRQITILLDGVSYMLICGEWNNWVCQFMDEWNNWQCP